ncbi:MAG: amidophosphoribosyltransferase [Oligoflexia bacterium]|nr:amidophosphoribosyltransferase [Oligoflexia bacterium]
MCGILGIIGSQNVTHDLYNGLMAIQHRGQDSAGIVTFDETFKLKKGIGLVKDVFLENNFENSSLNKLTGNMGLAHVRYSTIGTPDELNAQPFTVSYPFGLAMVHNGNLTNFVNLKDILYKENHRLVSSSCDLELILYVFASELEKIDLNNLNFEQLVEVVTKTQKRISGAYSTLTMIANNGLLAFTDPHGIRPMVMGEKIDDNGSISYAFASESTCFDYLGYKLIKDLAPGEIIYIERKEDKLFIHSNINKNDKNNKKEQYFCIFEYIYFAREDSIIHGLNVAKVRESIGKLLATRLKSEIANKNISPDIIIEVPSSAFYFAWGLSKALSIEYAKGFAKNNFIGRSFIKPTPAGRKNTIKQKLNPIKEIVRDKNILVVDDSLVRGNTSKHIISILKEAGAKEIYFVSAAPPIKHPCVYGIDMSTKTELLAATLDENQIAKLIGADKVYFQSIDQLINMCEMRLKVNCCYACFNGKYPTHVDDRIFADVSNERHLSQGNYEYECRK